MRGSMKQGVIAGLDIGTTKIACIVARVSPGRGDEPATMTVLGAGHQVSRGIKRGVVVDIQSAEEAIRAAVDAAERMAGVVVERVWVNFSHAGLRSRHASVEIDLPSHEVGRDDVAHVLNEARALLDAPDVCALHGVPLGYAIDGSRGIRDPLGMVGDRLGVTVHLVTAPQAPVRNLSVAVKRCHLDVAGFVAAPYASGLASLVDDEMDLGVTVIDMGGGTSSLAVFFDGRLMFTDVVAVGGQHVTSDLARGLSTPLSDAERMKTLYGSALPSPADERDLIDVPQIGEDFDGGSNQVPRSALTGIIQPRIEETLELIRDRIKESGFEDVAGRRVVLTGGGSQLTGAREVAARVLGKPVRIGRPGGLSRLPETMTGPAFTACAGVVAYSVRAPREALRRDVEPAERGAFGSFSRIGRWLKANF